MTLAFVTLTAILMTGCEEPASPHSLAPVFGLERLPADAACVSPGRSFNRLTFHIRPREPVTATLDGRLELQTAWDDGFQPDPSGATSIRDAGGSVIVSDGQTISLTGENPPRLASHLVCIGDTIWIFDETAH